MGLFTKKEACPVCGGEVKGLFFTKIGDKRLCVKNALNRFPCRKIC